MTTDWITSMAMSGGSALAQAMATDGWNAVRARCASLFAHGGPERGRQLLRQLDDDAAAVTVRAGDQWRPQIADAWRVRLSDLLKAYPEARSELAKLIVGARITVHHQQIVATDHGVVYAVQDGQQHITNNGPATR